jgi:hypothetical protein
VPLGFFEQFLLAVFLPLTVFIFLPITYLLHGLFLKVLPRIWKATPDPPLSPEHQDLPDELKEVIPPVFACLPWSFSVHSRASTSISVCARV